MVISISGCSAIGATGPDGEPGISGSQGTDGAVGPSGATGATGGRGANGATGSTGAQGLSGAAGPQGITGGRGATGANGEQGVAGPAGSSSSSGATGAPGAPGSQGTRGEQGIAGPTGPMGSGEAALFYALMPGDNAATVAVGSDVQFPNSGPTSSTGIFRNTASSFKLVTPGVYRVIFQTSINEAGQLELTLNGSPINYTVTGRATGTSYIGLTTLIQTTVADSLITVRNPAGNSTALTLTPLAGGTNPVAATLLIELVKAN